jgi:C-methyltransferase
MTTPTASAAPQGPAAIFQMLNAAQVTALLTSGVELGFFAKLDGAAATADELATRIGCPARTTRMLAEALTVIGLCEKNAGKYRLSPLAAETLVPGRPAYIGDMTGILGSPMMWQGLSRLGEAVRAGGSVLEQHAETPENPFWETFATSSGSVSMVSSQLLGGLLGGFIAGKKGPVRVLDIAAGSGIYGYSLCKAYPNVELTALDWPNVLEKTREWGQRLGIDASRVHYLAGNLFEVDFGGPYDVILASHIYHHFDPATCLALTRKIAGALAPRGRVAVHEFLTDGDNPAGIMFAITMLVSTRKGTAYTHADFRGWFAEAGLASPTVHPNVGLPTSFLVGEKP